MSTFTHGGATLYTGDCMAVLPTLPAKTGRYVKGERRSIATEFKKGQHWRTPQSFREKAWLLREYVEKTRSANEIALQFGVTATAITFWLRRHGIKRRTTSETRKVKHWGQSGSANPMFHRRGPLSHTWRGGITPYRQAIYGTWKWGQFARSIFARDKVCKLCGAKGNRHIHHIIPVADAPLLIMDPGNVVLLCEQCHWNLKGKEKRWQKRLFAIING
jgi:transposase-like protein